MLTYFVVPCRERVGPPGGGPEWEGRAAAAESGLSPGGEFVTKFGRAPNAGSGLPLRGEC
jgi:hypothetical protein